MLTLEEATKEELISYIKQRYYPQPTQRELLGLRWERLSKEAMAIMKQSNDESQKWSGKGDFVSLRNWNEAQEIFTKGMKLAAEADKVFEQMQNTNR